MHHGNSHPWHGIAIGEEAPAVVRGVVEIPCGSRAKYELDKESGLLKLDRVLFSSVYYPANYGFIPRTYCDDSDPLDILILSSLNLMPLCVVEAKVIGVMHMVDGGEADDKIIAVADKDMGVNHYNNLADLPAHLIAEMQNFFEDYKKLEHKEVQVKEFQNREQALKIIIKAMKSYEMKFGDFKKQVFC